MINPVSLVVGGKTYSLRIDNQAAMLIQDELGLGMVGIAERVLNDALVRLEDVAAILGHAIQGLSDSDGMTPAKMLDAIYEEGFSDYFRAHTCTLPSS